MPHHLLDVIDPDQEMTAARFVELADAAIAGAAARGAPVVVAGGTGLYVRALLLGLFAGPAGDPALRARLTEPRRRPRAARPRCGSAWPRVDPEAAARIERNDLRRIIRALEVLELTGSPMSAHQRRHDHRRVAARYPARVVGLCPLDRAELYRRIDARVDRMMEQGLLDEVRALRRAGYGAELRSQAAIGYAELHRHLDGALSLPSAVELAKRNPDVMLAASSAGTGATRRSHGTRIRSAVAIADLERYLVGPRSSVNGTKMATPLSEREILDFERPIIDLERKIEELRGLSTDSIDFTAEIRKLEQKARKLQREVFADLTPQQKVQLSRHPARPYTLDYVAPAHGGLRRAARRPVVPRRPGHRRRLGALRRAGGAGPRPPEGAQHQGEPAPQLRHAAPRGLPQGTRLMRLAARFGRPIICFIDTPGAYPGHRRRGARPGRGDRQEPRR